MILGIRSFDNARSETIQFESPLTLVVGVNGSGKTTIIECLKYATAGLQPPGARVGGAFVHDPKLTGEKEIMAQVRLSFTAATGAAMTVTRSLQLTVKKTARTVKTLEGSLVVKRNGERHSISNRVAELDSIVPQYMGVSTAVLDNVIFCHQDESLWPMSDSSTLKKKFDEIFEAQKYTKAIANIKDIRKAHNEELGKLKIMEQHAKEEKDRGLKARKRMEQLQDEIEILRVQCEDLATRIEKAQEAADKAWRESESYAKLLGALEGKRIEARSKQSTVSSLREHLKEVPESDEWIQSTLDQFDLRMAQYQQQKEGKQEQYLELETQVKGLRSQLDQKLAMKGKHQQDKDEYERSLVRRRDMIRQVAASRSIRGYDDLADDSVAEEFMVKLGNLAKSQNTSLDRARREADTEKREAQALVNKLTERRAALQDSKVTSKGQATQNDRDARDYQGRVNQIQIDEGSKAIIESRIEDANGKLRAARDAAQKADWDSKTKTASADLRSLEDESTRLNNELVQGTKKAGETARLAHLKQELKERQRSLQTLVNAHGDRIKKLVGDGWQPGTAERMYQAVLDEANRELAASQRERDQVARELEQVQFKQKTYREDLAQKKAQAKEDEEHVRAAINAEPEDYDRCLKDAEEQLDDATSNVKGYDGMKQYFDLCMRAAKDRKPACRTCMRGYKGPDDPEVGRLVRRIEGLIRKVETDAQGYNVDEAEANHKQILDAGIPLERWKNTTNELIPSLEAQIDDLSQQRDNLVTRVEEHDKSVEQRQQAKTELEAVSRTITSIGKHNADITSYAAQVEELSAKQSQQSAGKTLEDIQEDIAGLSEQIREVKKTMARLTSEQNQSTADISSMDLELRDLKNELNTTTYQLEKKASLVARVGEFNAANQKLREAVDKTDKELAKLEPEIETAQLKYDDVVERWDSKERELMREATQLSDSVNGLRMINDQIKSYLSRGGPTLLTKIDREIKHAEQDINSLKTEQAQASAEANRIIDQLRDSENTRRQYSDNLRYRQESRALENLKAEIQELAAHNAEVDRDRFQQESTRLTKEHHRLSAQHSGALGEMKSKDVQLMQLAKDYDTEYLDAPKRYKEAHIKVETTKAAVEDLARYGGALDKAIMKYHSLKMQDINGIIDELWKKCYQGTDVDTIMIRADNESQRKDRSYNYRVVMVKQDAEMDMRGRCSAGQKVLASIIIRLALAEVFSANCGLIALDEPTTNLDRDNIVALAKALHDIIQTRRHQSNFQMIIITHDEEFLGAMQCGDLADYYWRISRNDRQNSIIERQSIQGVM